MQPSDTMAATWGLERKLQGSDLGELSLQNLTPPLEPCATERRGIPAVAMYVSMVLLFSHSYRKK